MDSLDTIAMKTLLLPVLFTFLALLALPLVADEQPPRGAETFGIEGHKAFVHPAPAAARGKRWLWYAPTLKGASFGGRRLYSDGLMQAGIGVAEFDLGKVRGSPASTANFSLF